jgi:hypothetical protein
MAAKQQTKANAVAKKLGVPESDLIYIGEGLWCFVAVVTPAVATEWLQFNTGNRTMKERSVETFADDQANGNWKFTHQGIAFGYDGELKDGQNRLEAVKKSGKTIRILVFIGLSDDAKGVVDTGVVRTNLDAAKFAGVEATKLALSASKICEVGLIGNTKGISNMKAIQLVEKHKEAYAFLQEHLFGETKKPQKGIATSSVCAAIMRAYYAFRDHPKKLSRLKKFCTILQDGQYGKVAEDVASFRLREKIRNQNWSGSSYAKQLYKLTEQAIILFEQQKSVTAKGLHPVAEEAFPLPHEIPSPAAA